MRCLLVYPRFLSASFWNYRETCRVLGVAYPTAPLGLVTVAAMLPATWELRLVDRNVQALRDEDVAWADIVFTGGMIAQQQDAVALIHELEQRGKRVVVGGPDATTSPHVYAEADHRVLGEAEVTLPEFLADLETGRARALYASPDRADVTTSPCPRFDLLDLSKYLYMGIQWCRGCPFSCEFCDIIELYGRIPRAKTTPQMLRELQVLHDLGWRGHVDFVDDNFIGNKKLAKQFLPALRTWLEERDWPFEFSTEASLNLADDPELLGLMQDVGFFVVFVGIETPDEATLISTRKRQNTKRSIADSVRRIYAHGMYVMAGYIIGFDAEEGSVARGLTTCVEQTAIPVNMVGLLHALPTTQLTRRLLAEGRLHADYELVMDGVGDQCTAGLNFETRRPRSEILGDYLRVIETIYEPRRYFDRVLETSLALDSSKRRYRNEGGKKTDELKTFARIVLRLGCRVRTARHFWRVFFTVLRRNPASLRQAVGLAAFYLHHGPFARHVARATRRRIAAAHARPALAHATPREPVAGPA